MAKSTPNINTLKFNRLNFDNIIQHVEKRGTQDIARLLTIGGQRELMESKARYGEGTELFFSDLAYLLFLAAVRRQLGAAYKLEQLDELESAEGFDVLERFADLFSSALVAWAENMETDSKK